jgi:hypothetical protein
MLLTNDSGLNVLPQFLQGFRFSFTLSGPEINFKINNDFFSSKE